MFKINRQLFLTIFFVGISLIKAYSGDGFLSFRLVHPDHDKLTSSTQSRAKIDKNRYEYLTKENESYWVDRKIELDIHDLKDAKIKIMKRDAGASQWEYAEITPETFVSLHLPPSSKSCLVDIYFDRQGRKKMASVTEKNIGRRLAIVFQGKLLVAPLIREKIDAEYVTVGSLSFNEARLLKDAITGSSNK
jgi:preprotein translocase subunit SecD